LPPGGGMAAPEEVLKYCKRFTEGIGYFVCFLIFLFIAYSYFSFGEPFLDEDSGELQTAITNVKGFREYLVLLAIFLISSIICSATDRLPFIGILVSAVPVYYVVRLYHNKMLVYMPMIIMLLSLFFFSGEIIATVQWVAKKLKK
jgi:hypothetical protein